METKNVNKFEASYNNQLKATFAVALGMIAVIGTVYYFQYILGYIPCKLCLGQREPYYIAIPLALIGLVSMFFNWPKIISRILLGICGLLMIYAMYLGVQHAGVEWKWWDGPGDCGAVNGGEITNSADLLNQLITKIPPSCNDAAGRFLGLSFAGWNVVASSILAIIAFTGLFKGMEKNN